MQSHDLARASSHELDFSTLHCTSLIKNKAIRLALAVLPLLFAATCRMSVPEPTSLCSVDTEFSADAVECAPFDRQIVLCATYQVDKHDQAETYSRRGRCILYQTSHDGRSLCAPYVHCLCRDDCE